MSTPPVKPVKPSKPHVNPLTASDVLTLHVSETNRPADALSRQFDGLTAPDAFNWRDHAVGPLAPCRICRRKAFMRDENGQPCHKVCAEKQQATTTRRST